LLIPQILVRGEQHVKTGFLCSLQQFSIAQRIPSLRSRFFYGVVLQGTGNASWRAMIEEHTR